MNQGLPLRKNYKLLTPDEWNRFVQGVKLLRAEIKPGSSMSTYDRFVSVHNTVLTQIHSIGTSAPMFLPWHRQFLQDFEYEMTRVLNANSSSSTPPFAIPYWDWADDASAPASSPLWSDKFVGGDGSPVSTGPFANLPAFSPPGVNGTKLLSRAFGNSNIFPDQARPIMLFSKHPPPSSAPNDGGIGRTYQSFYNSLEGIHNDVHGWIGGHMSNPQISPNDPVFWLHHSNVDRLWAQWEALNPDAKYTDSKVPGFSSTSLLPAGYQPASSIPVYRTLGQANYDFYMTFRSFTVEVSTMDRNWAGTDDQVWVGFTLDPAPRYVGVTFANLDAGPGSDPFEKGQTDDFNLSNSSFSIIGTDPIPTQGPAPDLGRSKFPHFVPGAFNNLVVLKRGSTSSGDWRPSKIRLIFPGNFRGSVKVPALTFSTGPITDEFIVQTNYMKNYTLFRTDYT